MLPFRGRGTERWHPWRWWAWGLIAEYTQEQEMDGSAKPWYLGRAYWRFYTDSTVCVVMPFHILVGAGRAVYLWLRRAFIKDVIRQAYEHGQRDLSAVRAWAFDRGWRVGSDATFAKVREVLPQQLYDIVWNAVLEAWRLEDAERAKRLGL